MVIEVTAPLWGGGGRGERYLSGFGGALIRQMLLFKRSKNDAGQISPCE